MPDLTWTGCLGDIEALDLEVAKPAVAGRGLIFALNKNKIVPVVIYTNCCKLVSKM